MKNQRRESTKCEQSGEQKAFALLEAICRPVSFLALLGIPVLGILRWSGMVIPPWLINIAFPILLSAAIGYLTNWIAIEMLFRPYEKTMRHPFAFLTCGYWQQGLIPKNKEAIAETIGATAEQKLIRPQALAEDLCGMVGEFMEDKNLLSSTHEMLQAKILENRKIIADALAPRIEEEVLAEIGRLLTPDKVRAFWNTQIEPMLMSKQTQDRLAEILTNFIETHASDLAEEIRPAILRMIQDYFREMGGSLIGSTLSIFADAIASGILSKQTLADGIRNWVRKPDSLTQIREKMVLVLEACREYAASSQTDDAIGEFVSKLCGEFKDYLHDTLSERLQAGIQQIAQSDELWNALVNQIPKCKPEVERFVSTHGLPVIIEKLNIGGRIREAIMQQDMPAFHAMINEISSQHLCAIQVLGFFLGGLAGTLLVLVR